MGAKQSKRSVDIHSKEAEGVGEVAGAGGEGRLEPLADADTLKPQINGDAQHIHAPDEQTEKEKQLDNGTPENEKDATTEKETKENETETEKAPLTNGDSEKPEQENGHDAPVANEPQDSGKKPKKEKVKKKWSIRSISFSRKDKPKQEKKPKEEEPKANGEPEKLPEETPEISVEAVENKPSVQINTVTENKDEKTPETPVTEPITNGSSAPDSKVESPVNEDSSASAPTPDDKVQVEEPKKESTPEPLPVNGLAPTDTTEEVEVCKEVKAQEVKSEQLSAVAPEKEVAAVDSSVAIEVCVEQMPLIESTPPPLPANPPPSSVATFAETMLTSHIEPTSLIVDTAPHQMSAQSALTADVAPAEETLPLPPSALLPKDLPELNLVEPIATENKPEEVDAGVKHDALKISTKDIPTPNDALEIQDTLNSNKSNENDVFIPPAPVSNLNATDASPGNETTEPIGEIITKNVAVDESVNLKKSFKDAEEITNNLETADQLRSVDALEGAVDETGEHALSTANAKIALENIINKSKTAVNENNVDIMECNGNIEEPALPQVTSLPLDTIDDTVHSETVKMLTTPDDPIPPSIPDLPLPDLEAVNNHDDNQGSNEESESFPEPPSELCPTESEASAATSPEPQEPLPVSDKLTGPVTPEVVAEITSSVDAVALQEKTSDVVVAN